MLTWKSYVGKTGSVTATTGSLKNKQTEEQHLIAMVLLYANSRKHFYHWKDSNEEIMTVMQEELSYYKVTLFKSEIRILSFLWSLLRPRALFQIHQCHKTTAGDHQRQLLDLGLPSLQDHEAGKLHFMKHSVESVPPQQRKTG